MRKEIIKIVIAMTIVTFGIKITYGVTEEPSNTAAYREDIRNLLARSEYSELQSIAMHIMHNKSRFPDGTWKLPAFFDAVTYPRDQSSLREWDNTLSRLMSWMSAETNSVIPYIAMGSAQLNYAWNIRDYGFASTVSESQWTNFYFWISKAKETIGQARVLDATCPEIYRCLLRIAISQNATTEEFDDLFKAAVLTEPDYYDFYLYRAYSLMERWYGEPGDWQKFIQKSMISASTNEQHTVYTRTTWALYPYYRDNFFESVGISWEIMKMGFYEILAQHPNSAWNLNNFCFFSTIAKDRETAAKLFEQIGTNRDRRIWRSLLYFHQSRAWALDMTNILTTFSFDSNNAISVDLASDFNEWNFIPLQKTTGGLWKTSIALPPGEYAYKFVVDKSDWLLDPTADSKTIVNGAENSLLVVGE